MSAKKFKSIGILFLSIIFLATSCLYSLSFAIIVPHYPNMPEGKYYIQNKESSYFMGGLDFYSIVQTSFNADNDMQKWELEYVSDGYYRIKNVYSGYYLTAGISGSPGATVRESALSSSNNAQLWKFNEIGVNDDYYWECKITAKSHENDGWDMALAGDSNLTSYGYLVIQDPYMEDTNYYDEWVLIPCFDAYLVGITRTDSGHNHTTALYVADDYISRGYFDVTTITTAATTLNNIESYMKKSHLFILRGDGGYNANGTWMNINTSNTSVNLNSWDVYDFTANTGIDVDGCYLAVFAGCYTANHSTKSLPKAAVRAGAAHAIGFANAPTCLDISKWTQFFAYEYTTNGANISNAVNDAVNDAGILPTNVSIVIY